MMLRYIGEFIGVRLRDTKPELSEAEKWVDAGFIPGAGQVPVVSRKDLPITVRDMMAELEKEGKLYA